jgi:chromosomal replication initiator protein
VIVKIIAEKIMEDVAHGAGYTVEDLRSKAKSSDLVEVRHFAMQRVRSETGLSYPEIGRLFNRDHTSVIHACKKIGGEL